METPIRILIVEDEFLISMQLEFELNGDFDVIKVVSTGEKALTFVREILPDLILMDIGLPEGINGIETAKRIHLISNIPIVFMTGYSDQITRNNANEVKPIGYLLKPVFLRELKLIIEAHFSTKKKI